MLTVASKARSGNNLFRGIGDHGKHPHAHTHMCTHLSGVFRPVSAHSGVFTGLISYTEYLFLLTILTSKSLKFYFSSVSAYLRSRDAFPLQTRCILVIKTLHRWLTLRLKALTRHEAWWWLRELTSLILTFKQFL